MIVGCEGMTQAQEADAKSVLDLLSVSYPGHPWHVRVWGGTVFIRYLAFDAPYGMNLRITEVDHDAAVFKKKVVMLAGEWLERAGLVRGRNNEDEIQKVEGVPDRWQPPEYRFDKFIEKVVIAERDKERTEMRPAAEQEMKNDQDEMAPT